MVSLFLQDACFTELRTNQKLGYVVFCFSHAYQGVGSFQVIVQSQQFLPEHILNSTDTFLSDFYRQTVLSQKFADDFVQTLSVLRQTLTKRDLNLKDKTDRLWDQILSGQNQFNFVDQQVSVLNSLGVEGFRDFYNTYILGEDSRRRLLIVVYGKDKEFTPPVKNLVDYGQLDQTSATLPLQS